MTEPEPNPTPAKREGNCPMHQRNTPEAPRKQTEIDPALTAKANGNGAGSPAFDAAPSPLTSLRARLVQLGYTPLPCRSKVPVAEGWNRPGWFSKQIAPSGKGDTPEKLASWERR